MENISRLIRQYIFFISVVFVFVFSSQTYSQNYIIKTYTQESGLPSSIIYSVFQGKDGRIWMGSYNGIAVYNGHDWSYYNSSNSCLDNEIICLREDNDGNVWVLSRNPERYFTFFDGLKWNSFEIPKSLRDKNLSFRSFNIYGSGIKKQIVATSYSNGLICFHNSKWENITTKNGLPSNNCSNVIVHKNKFFVATEKGIAIIDDGKVDLSLNKIIPGEFKNIVALAFEGDSKLWVLSKNCIGYIENKQFIPVNKTISVNDDISGLPVQLIPDYYGLVYWANKFGINSLDKSTGEVNVVNEQSGIRVLNPNSLLIDREWNLWITGGNGVNKLRSRRFKTYRKKSGLFKDEVYSIVERDKGEMIFGHTNGFTILKNDKFKNIVFNKNENSGNSVKVLDLCKDSSQNIWFAAEKFGIGKLDRRNNITWYKIKDDDGYYAGSVTTDLKGNIYAISNSALYRLIDNKFEQIKFPEKVSIKGFRKLFVSPENEICISTFNDGILLINNNKIRIIKNSSNKRANNVFSAYFDRDYGILVGTYDGLYKVEQNSLNKFQLGTCDERNPVYFITKDNDENIWIGTDRGVVKWDGEKTKKYSVKNGLAGLETNRDAGFLDSSNNMWVGTDRGVSRYLKEFDTKSDVPPIIILETIEPDAGLLTPDKEKTILVESGSLILRVSVVSFAAEEFNSFQYKLEGYDKYWNDSPSSNPLIKYGKLPPGNYKLIVRGQNSDGICSPYFTYSNIIIPLPFYRSWWFYSFIILFVVFIVVVIVNNRMKGLYSRKLQYEVERRTAMLYKSEERYRQMFEKNQAIMLLIDAEELDIIDANESAERFYGFDKQSLINFNYTQLSTLGSVEDVLQRIRKSISIKELKLSVHRLAMHKETFVEVGFSEINVRERKMFFAIIHNVNARIFAEEALKESEGKYRSLIESMTDGVFLAQDEKLLFVNNSLSEFIGYKPNELVNQNFCKYIVPEDIEMVCARHKLRLNDIEPPNEYVLRLLHKDGVTRITAMMHVSKFIYKGKPATLGTLKDITESRKQELKLNQFFTAIEQAPVGVMITSYENDIEYANPEFCKITGYRLQEIMGKKPFILHGQEDIAMNGDIRNNIKKGKVWSGEILNRKKDGSQYWVMATVSPIKDTEGKITHFISVEQDITFEKYAREEIKRNEKLLSSIISHAPVIIAAIDNRGYVTFLRGKELESQGLEDDQLVGISVFDNFKENTNLCEDVERALRGEILSSTREFNELIFELHYNPMIDSYGEINGTIVIALNITERHNTHQKLIAAKEEAEKTTRLKSEFLAQMSHEIRTPVNTILSFSSLLQQEVKNKVSDELSEVFNFIDDGGRRLIHTIDMILNMSQFQTGTYKPIMSILDLNKDVLNKITAELKSAAIHKNLSLEFVVQTDDTLIMADSYTVGQIFINLIDNAIKYTHQGKIEVRILDGSENICVEVEDTGIGISREYIPSLFDAFSQEEAGYSRRFEGTGLGLALVKKYIEINNAEIKVKSNKGDGTKFSVLFKKSQVN
jgi:PAS domain S-box-containing protein